MNYGVLGNNIYRAVNQRFFFKDSLTTLNIKLEFKYLIMDKEGIYKELSIIKYSLLLRFSIF